MNLLKQLIKDSQELRKTTFLSPKRAVEQMLGTNPRIAKEKEELEKGKETP